MIINLQLEQMATSAVTQTDLLHEIWSKVFEYLLADDRKTVRLTCHRFYEIANCISLLKSEEIIFYGNITFASIGSLASCRRKIWNLKFVEVNLSADSGFLSFFQSQGAYVHSLVFDRCTVIPESLKYMIVNCVNLRSFAISGESFRRGHSLDLNYILDDFNALRLDGIVRQHVTRFTLKMNVPDYNYMTNAQFLNFFAAFPNIKELYLQCDFKMAPDVRQSLSKYSFSTLHRQIFEMRNQLEKLSLNLSFWDNDDGIEVQCWNKISSMEMEKLKELSIGVYEFQVLGCVESFIAISAPYRV